MFSITVDKLEIANNHEIYKINLNGYLNLEDSHFLREKIFELVNEGVKRIILDFMDLNRISSSGMGILIALNHHMQKEGGTIVIANSSEEITEVTSIVNLDRIIKSFKKLKNAVDYFEKQFNK